MKIIKFIISTIILTLLVSNTMSATASFFSSFITEDQQQQMYFESFKAAGSQPVTQDFLNMLVDKPIKLETRGVTISKAKSCKFTFNPENKSSVTIKNTPTDNSLQFSAAIEKNAYTISLKFSGKEGAAGAQEKDFTTVLTTSNVLELIQKYGKPTEAFSVETTEPLYQFERTDTCPAGFDAEECQKIFDEFSVDIIVKLKFTLQSIFNMSEIEKGPFPVDTGAEGEKTTDFISSSFSAAQRIQFRLNQTLNPTYKVDFGTIFYYDGRSKKEEQVAWPEIKTDKPMFTNFFSELGSHQIAISQDVVNHAYLDLVKLKSSGDISIEDQTVESLENIFPGLGLNYGRDDMFTINNSIDSFYYGDKDPNFAGTFSVKLPNVDGQEREIQISYEYNVDNIFMSAGVSDHKLNINLITKNSYLSDYSLSLGGDEAELVIESNLRVWLLQSLNQVYQQAPNHAAFNPKTEYTVLFNRLAKDSFFYNGYYIFVLDKAASLETRQVLLKFLGK